MKYSLIIAALISVNAFANQDVAVVTDVNPAYRMVQVPYNECRMESVAVQVIYPGETIAVVKRQDGLDRILSMAAGGALGSTIGSGDGRKAATVIGAIAGQELIGKKEVVRKEGRAVTEYRDVERCSTHYRSESVLDGYIVKFNYNGIIGSTKRSSAPNVGETIPVNVTVNAR